MTFHYSLYSTVGLTHYCQTYKSLHYKAVQTEHAVIANLVLSILITVVNVKITQEIVSNNHPIFSAHNNQVLVIESKA